MTGYAVDPIDALSPGLAARLPWNYLPAALPAITGQADAPARHVLSLAGRSRSSAATMAVTPDLLQDPVALAALLTSNIEPLGLEVPLRRCFLGPPVAKGAGPNLAGLAFTGGATGLSEGLEAVVVVIDGGIAFWDAAFRSGGACMFHEMRFPDFDAVGAGNTPDSVLDAAGIAVLCALADTRGQRAVIRELAARYPASFHGQGGLARAAEGWHGTGVADLVAGGAAGKVALFGIDLPVAVLRDHDGDSLSATLALTVEMALAATQGFAHLPLVIVLPFGFVAGPQDGTHPVAEAVAKVLRGADRKTVSLIVPAGNHRQDRCAAVLESGSPGAPPREVVWRIPPDDFSPNALDIVLEGIGGAGTVRHLVLTPPDGPPLEVAMQPDGLVFLRRDGDVVGAVLRRPDTGSVARLRLALAGTGRDGSGRAHPAAGDWRVGVRPEERAMIYALRDDRDPRADEARPHRAAVLDDPAYRDESRSGAPLMVDAPGAVVRRAGTLSLLATIPGVIAVAALERMGGGTARPAWYSGLRGDGAELAVAELVDDGWSLRGVDCAANGSAQRARLSGSSAAAALHARALLGLPPRLPG